MSKRQAYPPSARPIGVLIVLAFAFLVTAASLYVGAGYLDFEDDSEDEIAFKAEHRTQWAIQRTILLAGTLLLAAGITAYAARLDHPMATGAACVFIVGAVSGSIAFMASAQSPVAASYAAHGSVPAWAPAYEAMSSALWQLWYIGSYVGLMGLAGVLWLRHGARSVVVWATLLLVPYGYFFGIPANVFLAALPMGVQAILDRMPMTATAHAADAG